MSTIAFYGDDFFSPVTDIGMYSDGTPLVKLPDFEAIVERADTMLLKADSLTSFMTGMALVDAVNWKFGWIKNLVIPYLPGARQDRINPTGDVLPMAFVVAEAINNRAFSRVTALDPHSEVLPDRLKNFTEYPLNRVAQHFEIMDNRYDGIIAPDRGSRIRAKEMADALGLPIFYGGKTRDVSTGKLTGFTLDRLDAEPFYTRDGHYLVVDDICDGGGTFVGLAEQIAEQGATADLYVSHGIFSKGTASLDGYGNVYTTDSFDSMQAGMAKKIEVVEDMVRWIRG